MDSLDIYGNISKNSDGFLESFFGLANKSPINFDWEGAKDGAFYLVKVHYSRGIQFISVAFTVPVVSTGTKRHEMILVGLPPTETYRFEKDSNGDWILSEIE